MDKLAFCYIKNTFYIFFVFILFLAFYSLGFIVNLPGGYFLSVIFNLKMHPKAVELR